MIDIFDHLDKVNDDDVIRMIVINERRSKLVPEASQDEHQQRHLHHLPTALSAGPLPSQRPTTRR